VAADVPASGRHPPGGPSSIILGGDDDGVTVVPDDAVARPQVGGNTSIRLGTEPGADAFARDAKDPSRTGALVADVVAAAASSEHSARVPPGGETTLILGGDVPPAASSVINDLAEAAATAAQEKDLATCAEEDAAAIAADAKSAAMEAKSAAAVAEERLVTMVKEAKVAKEMAEAKDKEAMVAAQQVALVAAEAKAAAEAAEQAESALKQCRGAEEARIAGLQVGGTATIRLGTASPAQTFALDASVPGRSSVVATAVADGSDLIWKSDAASTATICLGTENDPYALNRSDDVGQRIVKPAATSKAHSAGGGKTTVILG